MLSKCQLSCNATNLKIPFFKDEAFGILMKTKVITRLKKIRFKLVQLKFFVEFLEMGVKK